MWHLVKSQPSSSMLCLEKAGLMWLKPLLGKNTHPAWLARSSATPVRCDDLCVPSWDLLDVLKGSASWITFDRLASLSRSQPTFGVVAGKCSPNQPAANSSARCWPLASGNGLLQRTPAEAKISPWALRNTSYSLMAHIWLHGTPGDSAMGHPNRRSSLWSASRATGKPVVKSQKQLKNGQMTELFSSLWRCIS